MTAGRKQPPAMQRGRVFVGPSFEIMIRKEVRTNQTEKERERAMASPSSG
jgi:hypothetical protein